MVQLDLWERTLVIGRLRCVRRILSSFGRMEEPCRLISISWCRVAFQGCQMIVFSCWFCYEEQVKASQISHSTSVWYLGLGGEILARLVWKCFPQRIGHIFSRRLCVCLVCLFACVALRCRWTLGFAGRLWVALFFRRPRLGGCWMDRIEDSQTF